MCSHKGLFSHATSTRCPVCSPKALQNTNTCKVSNCWKSIYCCHMGEAIKGSTMHGKHTLKKRKHTNLQPSRLCMCRLLMSKMPNYKSSIPCQACVQQQSHKKHMIVDNTCQACWPTHCFDQKAKKKISKLKKTIFLLLGIETLACFV